MGLVPISFLCFVQCAVRYFKERCGVPDRTGHGIRHADIDRNKLADLGLFVHDFERLHDQAHAVRHLFGARRIAVKDRRELFSAIARHQIHFAVEAGSKRLCNLPYDVVPCLVAIKIIVFF